MSPHTKIALIKATVVLIPSYAVAWLTEQMVYVVPTLAAAGFFASSIGLSDEATTRRVNEDVDSDLDEAAETDEFD